MVLVNWSATSEKVNVSEFFRMTDSNFVPIHKKIQCTCDKLRVTDLSYNSQNYYIVTSFLIVDILSLGFRFLVWSSASSTVNLNFVQKFGDCSSGNYQALEICSTQFGPLTTGFFWLLSKYNSCTSGTDFLGDRTRFVIDWPLFITFIMI